MEFKKIKSSYFVKKIFYYIDESRKLKIVKYNKKMQNKIDLSIINYRIYSRKYIIYETNEKGKEYNIVSHRLIYEGEFLNGQRNGKGKEYYYDGKLEFEGEYLKGNKWNGKGYDSKKNIVYELKDGKGLIKLYDILGKFLSFEGEYLNGQINGKGKKYNYDGNLIFEGEFVNGKKNGKGK